MARGSPLNCFSIGTAGGFRRGGTREVEQAASMGKERSGGEGLGEKVRSELDTRDMDNASETIKYEAADIMVPDMDVS